jgi:CRISPR/Cas system-associated endoribonuclease Cas2
MQQQLLKLADEQEDVILYYYLCMPCVLKRESIGRRPKTQPEIVMV